LPQYFNAGQALRLVLQSGVETDLAWALMLNIISMCL